MPPVPRTTTFRSPGIAFHRLAQSLARAESSGGGRQRVLDDVDLERHASSPASPAHRARKHRFIGTRKPCSTPISWQTVRSNSCSISDSTQMDRKVGVAGALAAAAGCRSLRRRSGSASAAPRAKVGYLSKREIGDVVVVDDDRHVGLAACRATRAPARRRRTAASTPASCCLPRSTRRADRGDVRQADARRRSSPS